MTGRMWMAAAGFGILVVAAWLLFRDGRAEEGKQPAVVAVERGPIRETVSCTGRVVPRQEVEIKCKASGEVTSVPYDVSDVVEKGALLVELDPVDEQRRVNQAEVALAASQAQVELKRNALAVAERTLATDRERAEAALAAAEVRAQDAGAKAERMRLLFRKKLASEEERESAQTAAVGAEADLRNAGVRLAELKTQELALDGKRQDVRLAEAAVRSDEIALADAEQRLKETRVHSPITGVIVSRNVEVGQIVSSGISNVGGGTTLLTVADLDHMFALASVDESDIGRVKAGQETEVTVDAYPDMRFEGAVRRIAAKGVNTSNVVTFEVKVEVTDEKRRLLKPEMTATVQILVAAAEDALLVPAQAVTRTRRGYSVLAGDGTGATERRPVEVGVRNDTTVQITSGLAGGESVVLTSGEVESRWRRDGERRRGPMMFGPPRRGRR